MKENWFTSMLSEGGKISHKRWISVTIAAILGWAICYAIIHAGTATERKAVIDATMLFVLVMSGVATIAQIVSLVRGTPQPKEPVQEAEGPGDTPNQQGPVKPPTP